MKPEDIPAELRGMLDTAAGRTHSATGPVMTCLAEILTRHGEMVRGQVADEIEAAVPVCTVLSSAQVVFRAQGMNEAVRIARGDQ